MRSREKAFVLLVSFLFQSIYLYGIYSQQFSYNTQIRETGNLFSLSAVVDDPFIQLFTQPNKQTAQIGFDVCSHIFDQSNSEQRKTQREISYSFNNNLYHNYPISIYKFSLSAETSDG